MSPFVKLRPHHRWFPDFLCVLVPATSFSEFSVVKYFACFTQVSAILQYSPVF